MDSAIPRISKIRHPWIHYRQHMSPRPRAAPKRSSWTPEQWRVMRSPHRVHLIVALEALGDASVADLAALTGRTRQSLYPHLSAMARAGIIGKNTRSHRAGSATSGRSPMSRPERESCALRCRARSRWSS